MRDYIGVDNFIEFFVDCPVVVYIERDPKGIYAKALISWIKNFKGISSPYESPENPDLLFREIM